MKIINVTLLLIAFAVFGLNAPISYGMTDEKVPGIGDLKFSEYCSNCKECPYQSFQFYNECPQSCPAWANESTNDNCKVECATQQCCEDYALYDRAKCASQIKSKIDNCVFNHCNGQITSPPCEEGLNACAYILQGMAYCELVYDNDIRKCDKLFPKTNLA